MDSAFASSLPSGALRLRFQGLKCTKRSSKRCRANQNTNSQRCWTCVAQNTQQKQIEAKPSTTKLPPEEQQRSSFGRGRLHPRRLVGLYELERIGVNTKKLAEDSTRNELAFSSVVGLFTAAVLLPPLVSPGNAFEPAIASVACSLLFVWAVDALALENRFSAIFQSSIQDQRRVSRHEAGHFLCAYLSGIVVEEYSMTVLDAMRAGRPLAGLLLEESDDIDGLACIGMAGIAGESLSFGDSQGGAADMQELAKVLLPNVDPAHPPRSVKNMMRWGLLQAATLIIDHWKAFEKLSEAMTEKKSVAECVAIIEQHVNRFSLVP